MPERSYSPPVEYYKQHYVSFEFTAKNSCLIISLNEELELL